MAAEHAARQRWMSVLAQATGAEIERAWQALPERPEYRVVRRPEVGLVMVRGRAGGSGAPFNLGEMTVTRCTVDLPSGMAGHGYVAGRNVRHAELAAVFDALLQDPLLSAGLEEAVIAPLEAGQRERRRQVAARSAPTRVEFFTLVRGDD
jgi:alpha-D-ribose 1-methylphosphonate 5-triphosphate synthase subunit PhnG